MGIKKKELIELFKQKVDSGEIDVEDIPDNVRERIERGDMREIKVSVYEWIMSTDIPKTVSDRLPKDTSVKIDSHGNVKMMGFERAGREYGPAFRDKPRDKGDWLFFLDSKRLGWNSASGGLSNIKGHRTGPKKYLGQGWDKEDEHEFDIRVNNGVSTLRMVSYRRGESMRSKTVNDLKPGKDNVNMEV